MDRSRRKGGSNEPGVPLRCAESLVDIRRHCLNGEKETHSSVGLARDWRVATHFAVAQSALAGGVGLLDGASRTLYLAGSRKLRRSTRIGSTRPPSGKATCRRWPSTWPAMRAGPWLASPRRRSEERR